MLNGDVWIGLVYTPVAQVHINGLRPHASGLHQDAGLFHLLLQGVSVIGVAGESTCADDQVALERGGNAHLHAKLIRVATLSLGDALHLGRVPAVELGLFALVLLARGLGHQALGLAQRLAQGLLYGQSQGAHLAAHFALQAAHDGALALDDFAHALVLARVGVAPCPVAQHLALFGVGLFEGDSLFLGRLDELGACRLQ